MVLNTRKLPLQNSNNALIIANHIESSFIPTTFKITLVKQENTTTNAQIEITVEQEVVIARVKAVDRLTDFSSFSLSSEKNCGFFKIIFPRKRALEICNKYKKTPSHISFHIVTPTQLIKKPNPALEERMIAFENATLFPPFFL
ncbi:MAG: hypothetical protein E7622_00910 [Ruminococcaceae bacterium]|nr:hypothetical protein [Oscillospiraceae bacterium]